MNYHDQLRDQIFSMIERHNLDCTCKLCIAYEVFAEVQDWKIATELNRRMR